MENCYLYVLRYDYSGNYYVGSTTRDLATRMNTHFKEKCKKGAPRWSCKNKSNKGFKYYWFCVNEEGNSQKNAEYLDKELQSIGDRCENVLMERICEKIKEIKNCNLNREVYIIGGTKTKRKDYKDYKIERNGSIYDLIDEKLENHLKSLKSTEMSIKQGIFYISFWKEGKCK